MHAIGKVWEKKYHSDSINFSLRARQKFSKSTKKSFFSRAAVLACSGASARVNLCGVRRLSRLQSEVREAVRTPKLARLTSLLRRQRPTSAHSSTRHFVFFAVVNGSGMMPRRQTKPGAKTRSANNEVKECIEAHRLNLFSASGHLCEEMYHKNTLPLHPRVSDPTNPSRGNFS